MSWVLGLDLLVAGPETSLGDMHRRCQNEIQAHHLGQDSLTEHITNEVETKEELEDPGKDPDGGDGCKTMDNPSDHLIILHEYNASR